MDQPLKQRLIGAAVLAALAVIFLPMLLKGPDVHAPDPAEVPLSMPPTPGQDFETRELPLTVPEPAPAGGVLGMDNAAPAAPSTVPAGENAVPEGAVAPVAAPAVTAGTVAATPGPAPASAPMPAVKPGSESAATGAGAYVVNIGSFASRANAESLASKLRAAGLPVLSESVKIATGDATRLRVGPYADRAAGEAARLRAQSAANVSGTVIALDAAPSRAALIAPASAPKPVVPKLDAAKSDPVKAAATTASTATMPAPAPPPAAAASAGFAVQLSAPAAESDANALRDRARAAGLPSFVQRIETDSGVRYRVRVGPYADRASAEAALAGANAKLGTHGIVMRHP